MEKKVMEHKRKDADASLRQLHLGGPLWTAPRSLTRRCGSVQGGPGEPEDAPQGGRASRNEWLCRGDEKDLSYLVLRASNRSS